MTCYRTIRQVCCSALLAAICCATAAADSPILPTPQYYEPLPGSVALSSKTPASIVVGPPAGVASPKMALAADILRRELSAANPTLQIGAVGKPARGAAIHLWDFASARDVPVALNFLDIETLTNSGHYGQGYVIRSSDGNLFVIGGSEQGVLLGVMSVLQLIRETPGGLEVPGTYIRDYPDFRFRAASDWLLRIELSHWSLDRGQGAEAFEILCRKKLDRALRYKINMVLMDGFGWSLPLRFAGYGEMMRRLNRYARERGIHLIYAGYGAAYDLARQPADYLGAVFENRDSYPDGAKYRCFGDPHQGEGSCRSNEALNALKADELRRFVEAVEPGALYIHHEDCCAYTEFAKAWPGRCERCRKRWPNDDFSAPDGGAGAFAFGYSNLLSAVNGVKGRDGYAASRDCEIILVSPVYQPNSSSSEDWSNMLTLWRNIAGRLPPAANVQICVREVFPQPSGAGRFIQKFNWAIEQAGRRFGAFLFFIGGADCFLSDYPLTGAPSMNALFLGAASIYNACGDFYQEPMEIINAEYSWNTRSSGYYRVPLHYEEAMDLRARFVYQENEPPEVFGSGRLYEKACDLLYGPKAGPIMASYYRESVWLPDREPAIPEPKTATRKQTSYLPMQFDRIYAVPQHWLHLRADAPTWAVEIHDQRYLQRMAALKLDARELHRRLARRWAVTGSLNDKGADYIARALAAGPLPSSVEDLRFLQTAFRVYRPLLDALRQFHEGMELHFSPERNNASVQAKLKGALQAARTARQLAAENFPRTVDAMGGDVGSIRTNADLLIEAIENLNLP